MKRKRILVVEDEGIVAADLQDRLRSMDFDPVLVADSGDDALARAEESKPDLVLMDIQLKGRVDGVEAAQAIRDRLDIPVVFLTAHADEATFQRAKITAPFGYLLKPFNERELHMTLEIALHQHAIEAKLKRSELRLAAVLESIDEGIVVTDQWELIERMNSAAESLSGCILTDSSLKPFREVFRLLDPSTRKPAEVDLGQFLREESITRSVYPMILVGRGGAETLVDLSGFPIRDHFGRVTGLVWLLSRHLPGAESR